MGLFKKIGNFAKKVGNKVAEHLNFKTDPKLKGDLSKVSDNELIKNQRGTPRSLASAVTGTQ
jgi:hypothetical protein